MLVDGLPPRVARSQVAAQSDNSAALMGGEEFAEAFRRLDEWTQDRESAPFGLLNAALALGRDGDWLKDALPPVSQTVRESIERCAGDAGDAEHFTGDVEGWLELSGYRGDVAARARELRIRAATALLHAGRVVQAERVIRNVQPEDMRLNALYLEKSGRLEAAATLYERPDRARTPIGSGRVSLETGSGGSSGEATLPRRISTGCQLTSGAWSGRLGEQSPVRAAGLRSVSHAWARAAPPTPTAMSTGGDWRGA